MSEKVVLESLKHRIEKLEKESQKESQENEFIQDKLNILHSRLRQLRKVLRA